MKKGKNVNTHRREVQQLGNLLFPARAVCLLGRRRRGGCCAQMVGGIVSVC